MNWIIFISAILVFLALDLGVFHRKSQTVTFKEAFAWTGIWFTVAICFGLFGAPFLVDTWGHEERAQFISGYVIELSLSMDNVFVIALIFGYFGVELQHQHRVLFWGILGALVMRGFMIWIGAELVSRFDWILYLMGAFLLYSGIKIMTADENGNVDPEKNTAVQLVRRYFPVSAKFDGANFTTVELGRRVLTPMALVLVAVETTDVLFAVDSIPATFAVTRNPFIVFTSNVFAILGLRSLYFVLAGAIGYFRYLKVGLSLVLCLIGGKMLITYWYHMPTILSLALVAGIITVSVVASLLAARREKSAGACA